MAKKRNKASRKHLRNAAELKMESRSKFRVFLIALCIALAILAVYAFLISNAIIQLDQVLSIVVWILFVVVAGVVGWFGTKYSRANAAYLRYKVENDVSEDDVKEFLKTQY